MLKFLSERLTYALIGFCLGAVLGGLLWFMGGADITPRSTPYRLPGGLLTNVKYGGAFFAVIGFLFKDRVGDALGGLFGGAYRYEEDRGLGGQVPTAVAILALVAVAAAAWWHFHQP